MDHPSHSQPQRRIHPALARVATSNSAGTLLRLLRNRPNPLACTGSAVLTTVISAYLPTTRHKQWNYSYISSTYCM